MSHVNPQREDGHRQIENCIFQALLKQYMTGSEWAFCMAVIDKTYGFGKLSDAISYGTLQKMTGLCRQTIIDAVNSLEGRRIIVVNRSRLCSNLYLFNKHFDTWIVNHGRLVNRSRPSQPQATSIVNHGRLEIVNHSVPSKETLKETSKEIVISGSTINCEEKTVDNSVDNSAKKPQNMWPEEEMWLKNLILGKPFFHRFGESLLDYVWWDAVSIAIHGIDEEFLKPELARMETWFIENPSRIPTSKGIKRFMRRWLERAHENERRKR